MKVLLYVVVGSLLIISQSNEVFAQEQLPEHVQKYKVQGLPPIGPSVQYENHESFPPRLKGTRPIKAPSDFTVEPSSLTDEVITAFRQAALEDSRVKNVLGSRFMFITYGQTELEKAANAESGRLMMTLRFYSYSNNRAFDIKMIDKKVTQIIPKRIGYQPPESIEEVKAAEQIVRRDVRYGADVASLTSRGIQTPSPNRNRYIYLLFHKDGQPPAVFEAVVDMTAGRVVRAGRIQR